MKLGMTVIFTGIFLSLNAMAGGISSGTLPGYIEETWGGDHIQISVRGDAAIIGLDCAVGRVQSDFNTQQSKIDAVGTIVFGGGPGFSPEMPARYQAKIKQNKMFLKITAGGTVQTFVLSENVQGVNYPCLNP